MAIRKHMPLLTGLVVTALVAAVLPAGSAQAATTAAVGIQIKIDDSAKCFNVSGGSTTNGAKVIQYTCSTSGTNDRFTFEPKGNDTYWIRGVQSGKCLTVLNASTANSAAIIMYTCNTGANELWYVDEVRARPTIRLVSTHSGLCLNIPQGSTANNVGVIQYNCSAAQTSANERFYLPPTTSPTPVARAFTSKQPISVVQGAVPATGGVAPVYYSYVDSADKLNVLTVLDPDPQTTNPRSPVLSQSTDTFYTGQTESAKLADGRVQVVGHDAATGDVAVLDELTKGTGSYEYIYDIGGATAAQPTVGLRTPADGALGVFAVIGGALWYAPETVNNTQSPYGAWRSLGGTTLTGTPVVQRTATATQIFALNTSGQLQTATLTGTTLSDWTNLGGSGLTGTPAVTVYTGNVYAAAARSADGTVVYKIQQSNGTWPAAWTSLPGKLAAGSPTITFSPFGEFKIAIRGTDNLIYYTSETAVGSGQFSDWVQVSDPTDPETVAGGDPTLFTYAVPSGNSFGIAFPSAEAIDGPIVATFPPQTSSASPAAKSAAKQLKPTLRTLKAPAKATGIKVKH